MIAVLSGASPSRGHVRPHRLELVMRAPLANQTALLSTAAPATPMTSEVRPAASSILLRRDRPTISP